MSTRPHPPAGPENAEKPAAARRDRYHHGGLREALLDAAAELLRTQGPAGFSLREAARRVGVDPAACYRHFRDREDVLVALAQQGFATLAERMATVRARRRGASARARLLAMGHEYVAFACDDPARFRVMFGDSGTHARDPRLRLPSIERSAFEQLEDEVVAFAAEAGCRARLPETAYLLWSAMHGVARLSIDGAFPPGATTRGLVESLARAVLDERAGR